MCVLPPPRARESWAAHCSAQQARGIGVRCYVAQLVRVDDRAHRADLASDEMGGFSRDSLGTTSSGVGAANGRNLAFLWR